MHNQTTGHIFVCDHIQVCRSLTVARVMVIPRTAYNALCKDFPQSAKAVLDNLQQHAEAAMQQEFRGGTASRMLRSSLACQLGGLTYNWASAESLSGQAPEGTVEAVGSHEQPPVASSPAGSQLINNCQMGELREGLAGGAATGSRSEVSASMPVWCLNQYPLLLMG